MAAYAVSPFNCIERAWKPFNPILGETFELEVGKGVKYLAEQVRSFASGPRRQEERLRCCCDSRVYPAFLLPPFMLACSSWKFE